MSWRLGDCNLVVSVPHAGVLGQDTGPAGNLLCENGNVIETRKGSLQYPIKTYARDAQTDVIAKHMRAQLAEEGLLPHIIECHVHRSKVECKVEAGRLMAVRQRLRHRDSDYVSTTSQPTILQLSNGLRKLAGTIFY